MSMNANVFSQTNEWKTEKNKDGKVTVKSNISRRTDEKGDVVQLIAYSATTRERVNISNCISVLKDVSNHKYFLDEKESKMVKTISDNKWVIYYYFDSPWPMPDADCVVHMIFTEDVAKRTATFTLTAAPTLFEKKEIERMTYYNVTYVFKEVGDDEVEMTTTAKVTPVVQAPDWMVRSFFPEGPADILQRILKLAKNK